MIIQDDQKLNMSGLDFLAIVLQSSNSFNLKAFSIFLLFISSWLQGPSSIVALRGRVFQGVDWSGLQVFFSFEIFKQFLRETHFRKFLHFLYFCFNYGALNLHLHMVALSESVTML